LLNFKDGEILKLSQRIMDLQDQIHESELFTKNTYSINSPRNLNYSYGSARSSDRILQLECEVKRLNEELNSTRLVVNRQSNALQQIEEGTDYPARISSLMEDLRVQRSQNAIIKSKLLEEERKARQTHS